MCFYVCVMCLRVSTSLHLVSTYVCINVSLRMSRDVPVHVCLCVRENVCLYVWVNICLCVGTPLCV